MLFVETFCKRLKIPVCKENQLPLVLSRVLSQKYNYEMFMIEEPLTTKLELRVTKAQKERIEQ